MSDFFHRYGRAFAYIVTTLAIAGALHASETKNDLDTAKRYQKLIDRLDDTPDLKKVELVDCDTAIKKP